MAGPVLLAHFNHFAKSARETGDNRSYVEQAVPFLVLNHGGKRDFRLEDKLSHRLIAAEDRYRDNHTPFLNETHVAAAFNALRSRLANSKDYPVVEAEVVHKFRRFLSRWGDNSYIFPLEKSNYSPIEALLLLSLLASNDGKIDRSLIDTDPVATHGSSSCTVAGFKLAKPETPRFMDSLESQVASRFLWISQRKAKKMTETILHELNI